MSDTVLHTCLGYSQIPLATWLKAADQRDVVPGLFDPDLDEFKRHMRSLIPVPWYWRGKKEVAVVLTRGQRVKMHPHEQFWTLVYYAHAEDGVSRITIEDTIYPVDKDCAIVIPPNVMHGVPPTTEALRISVAFQVFDHDKWTLA